jgi:hypothetical protein
MQFVHEIVQGIVHIKSVFKGYGCTTFLVEKVGYLTNFDLQLTIVSYGQKQWQLGQL